RGLVTSLAIRTGVVGGEKRADDELAGLDRTDLAADLLHDAAVFVAHRFGLGDRINAAVVPQVRAAHAGRGQTDDGIRRLDDTRRLAFHQTYVAWGVENCSFHVLFLLMPTSGWPAGRCTR